MTRPPAWEPPLFEWSMHDPVPVELMPELRDDKGELLDGNSDIYRRVLEIDSTLQEFNMRVAVMHEALHLFFHDSGFDHIIVRLEEPFVQSLATWLVCREMFHEAGGVPAGDWQDTDVSSPA